MKRPLAYITAPWGDNCRENEENAARYCRQVYDAGYSPICPMLVLSTFLKDSIPQEHKDGIDMARDYGNTPQLKDYYEMNARRLITTRLPVSPDPEATRNRSFASRLGVTVSPTT